MSREEADSNLTLRYLETYCSETRTAVPPAPSSLDQSRNGDLRAPHDSSRNRNSCMPLLSSRARSITKRPMFLPSSSGE